MNIKKITIIMLVFFIFISFNIVSASDIIANDTLEYSIPQDIVDDSDYSLESVTETPLSSSNDSDYSLESVIETPISSSDFAPDVISSNESDDEYVIYVGQNITSDGGNGSYENPFATLDLACVNVSGGKEKVNLNIFNGTYYIGSELRFNTNNLNINSVNGDVIIKNLYDANNKKQSIGLTSTLANYTCSNIIFDASGWTKKNAGTRWFAALKGQVNLGIFNNCTFTGFDYTHIMYNEKNNLVYNNCKFINITDSHLGFSGACSDMNVTFNYCIFGATFMVIGMDDAESVIFNDVWFGQSNIPSYISDYLSRDNLHILRYAKLNVFENYLGNNQYEIIGKLMWNDTTDDDIDKLGPMTVTLSSSSGDLPETAILQDGIFRVIYNSTASTHDVTAKLDNEIIPLNFNTTDMTVNASDIIIGQDQNITVTLPQDFNGTLSIKVNNKTYETTVDNTNSITYKIPDVLPAGKHVIDVIFADEKNHIYGFNSTNITVSKVSDYDFNATVTPTVYLGDNATVTLSLPDGATGNVTVKVGDNEAKTFNVNDVISIDGFIAGDNVVNITFSSDIYDAKSVVKNVVASPKPTTITTVNVTTNYNVAKDLVITLTDVDGKVLANKTVNVVVGTVNNNLTTNASGQVSIDVSTLAPNTYVANIAFAGDDLYAKSNATANVVVNKIASSLTAPAVTATYNVGKNLVITLTANGKALANQKVTVKVGTISKTLTTNAKGQVSVDISKLTPKTYTATFTYAGDDINDKSSNTAKVVVNKAKPKITAKKATFKAKKKTKKYSIVLKDNKGKAKVTLKVKGKTYKATTNAKGKATFKITKLTKKGKQTATIKFGGNTLYKAVSKKVKLTIKK